MNDRPNGAANDGPHDENPIDPGATDPVTDPTIDRAPTTADAAAGTAPGTSAGTAAGRFGIRRPRTRAEERIAELDTSPVKLTKELDELRARAETAEQQLAVTTASWQRTAADFQNFKRRTELDRQGMLAYASERVLGKVLVIADDFDRAIAHAPTDPAMAAWVEGVTAIDRKIQQLLDSEGVTPIETVGKPFDPYQHQAIAHEPTTEAPDGTVLREFQRGYELGGRVLRPALVAVADNTTTTHQTDSSADQAHDSED